MGLIYMRTSPSGGNYIGQTIFKETTRWTDHVHAAYDKKSQEYNTILSRAIRKYQAENFSVTILENNIDECNLNEREIYWISQYKTFYLDNNHGYNMTRGGEGSSLYDTQIILNYWNQGCSIKEIEELVGCAYEAVRKRLNVLNIDPEEIRQRGRNFAACKYSATYQQKISPIIEKVHQLWQDGYDEQAISKEVNYSTDAIGRWLHSVGITEEEIRERGRIRQFNNQKQTYNIKNQKRNNLIIDLWNQGKSISDIYTLTGHARETISHILLDAGIEQDEINKQAIACTTAKKCIPVLQYDLNGIFIQEWPSASEAARSLGCDSSTISKCIRGVKKTCHGYIWKRKGE